MASEVNDRPGTEDSTLSELLATQVPSTTLRSESMVRSTAVVRNLRSGKNASVDDGHFRFDGHTALLEVGVLTVLQEVQTSIDLVGTDIGLLAGEFDHISGLLLVQLLGQALAREKLTDFHRQEDIALNDNAGQEGVGETQVVLLAEIGSDGHFVTGFIPEHGAFGGAGSELGDLVSELLLTTVGNGDLETLELLLKLLDVTVRDTTTKFINGATTKVLDNQVRDAARLVESSGADVDVDVHFTCVTHRAYS